MVSSNTRLLFEQVIIVNIFEVINFSPFYPLMEFIERKKKKIHTIMIVSRIIRRYILRFSEWLVPESLNARKQTWKWNVSTFVIIHGVNVSVGFTPSRIDSIHYPTPILSARHFLLFLQTARNVNARFHVTRDKWGTVLIRKKKKSLLHTLHGIFCTLFHFHEIELLFRLVHVSNYLFNFNDKRYYTWCISSYSKLQHRCIFQFKCITLL